MVRLQMRQEQVPQPTLTRSRLQLVHDGGISGRSNLVQLFAILLLIRVDVVGHEGFDLGERSLPGPAELVRHCLPPLSCHTSRSARRMILPVVVRGRSSTNSMSRGISCGASRVRTWLRSSSRSSSVGSRPGFSTTKAFGTCPRRSSGTPTTAAMATDGCEPRQFSISPGPIRYPAELMTSSFRDSNQT